jgi:hypothetical protein
VLTSSITTKAHRGGGSNKKDYNMYIVITTSYVFVAGLISLAGEEYKIGFSIRKFIKSEWPRFKKALIEAISYPYRNHF